MKIDAYRFAVIGPGRLGSALLAALTGAGLEVTAVGVHDEADASLSGAIPYVRVGDAALQADAWWLAVPDDEIRVVAGRLAGALPSGGRPGAPEPLVIHSSGFGSISLLDPLRAQGVRALCLHPLQTFAGEPSAELLKDVPCAVTAHEDRDLELGETLAGRLGMKPFRLDDEQKTRYHLAAVIGCNLLVALESEAKRLMDGATGAGDGLDNLGVLVRRTVENVLGAGDPARALTGPIARGDVGTVRAHLRLLDGESPRLARTYRALSLEALSLAAPRLDDEQVETLRELLGADEAGGGAAGPSGSPDDVSHWAGGQP